MLININPLLSPDLLHTLRSMGHRHDIAIVDATFPADSSRARIILDGVSATDVLDASIVDHHAPGRPMTAIDPAEFKQRADDGFAVVITGERRLYGGIIVRKGVIPTNAA